MDVLGKIRRLHFREGLSIRQIAKKTTLSRNTIRRYLRDATVEPEYPERASPSKLDAFTSILTQWLAEDSALPKKQRRTGRRLFEGLKAQGYDGSYDRVTAFLRDRQQESGQPTGTVFIPLRFAPGDAFQFDWSTEHVEINGQVTKLKVAHLRLSHSRKFYVRAYPGESHEMLFDAHMRAFAYLGGVPRRGIYDNMKTAVSEIGQGKARVFNRRFLSLASHYLFAPEACTPASGWEKGQVENQVGNLREWLFVPRLKFPTLAALNDWLEQRCTEIAQERSHPEYREQTVEAVFIAEKAALGALPPPFDGYAERQCRVTHHSLVSYERNRYSVPCTHVGHAVSLRVYADRMCIVAEGQPLAEHARLFGRYQTSYNPWHYLPALERKPGALRNGAPFANWDLPAPIKAIETRLMKLSGGDRQFVQILAAIPSDGYEAVAASCAQAIEAGVINADYVLNLLNRRKGQPAAVSVDTPNGLRLKEEPKADVERYDQLLGSELIRTIALLVITPLMNTYPPVMMGVSHAAA